MLNTIVAAIAFCLVSGAVYLINDLVDIEKDRQHPTKRDRPLPSGQLDPIVAMVAAAAIPLICIPAAIWFNRAMGLVLLAYFVLQLFYSFFLKNVVIIDVMTIAAGFVLRVAAGVVVIDVERFSPWLYVCMTLLALFLGFGKRRHELFTLQANANNHRASLEHYSLELIDQMSVVVISAAIMAYSLYTFSAPNLPRQDGQPLMMLTIPFVLYGLFRYQYLIHVKKEGGTPEELVLKDLPLIVGPAALWRHGVGLDVRPPADRVDLSVLRTLEELAAVRTHHLLTPERGAAYAPPPRPSSSRRL